MTSPEITARGQIAFFCLILLATAYVVAVLFGGSFRPEVIRLGGLTIPALQPIFAGLGLPALAVFGLPRQMIPALCYGGATIALTATVLWVLTSLGGRRSFGLDIQQAALVACSLGLWARGFVEARRANRHRCSAHVVARRPGL